MVHLSVKKNFLMFGSLKIYVNEKEIQKHDLELISWNLEPRDEKYGNFIVEKVF